MFNSKFVDYVVEAQVAATNSYNETTYSYSPVGQINMFITENASYLYGGNDMRVRQYSHIGLAAIDAALEVGMRIGNKYIIDYIPEVQVGANKVVYFKDNN